MVRSYLVLKCPSFCALTDPAFQSFHFCCFSLLAYSICAFLKANFNAFSLVFLLFFTFQGSLGRILSRYGTLNSAEGSGLVSSSFCCWGGPIGRRRCSLTTSCVLYFLYFTRYPSSSAFSITQGQNSPSAEQMALQCVPSLNSSASGSRNTLSRYAGSCSSSLVPQRRTLATCYSTSTSCTSAFFHFRYSCRKHLASLPTSCAASRSRLNGYASIFFYFSLRAASYSCRATSIFSFMARSSSRSSSSVSQREMRRLILASDFLSQMIEAQCYNMPSPSPAPSTSPSYLLLSAYMNYYKLEQAAIIVNMMRMNRNQERPVAIETVSPSWAKMGTIVAPKWSLVQRTTSFTRNRANQWRISMISKSAASLPFDSARICLPVARCSPFSDTTYKQYVLESGGSVTCMFYLSTIAALFTPLLPTSARSPSKEIRTAAAGPRYMICLVWEVHMWFRMERRQRRRQFLDEVSCRVSTRGQKRHSTCADLFNQAKRSFRPQMFYSYCIFSLASCIVALSVKQQSYSFLFYASIR